MNFVELALIRLNLRICNSKKKSKGIAWQSDHPSGQSDLEAVLISKNSCLCMNFNFLLLQQLLRNLLNRTLVNSLTRILFYC